MSASLRAIPSPPADPWLTLAEAAAEIDADPETLRRAIQQGRLRAARLSPRGPYRIRRSWRDAYLEHAVSGGPWPVPPSRPR